MFEIFILEHSLYSKTCLKRPLKKKTKNGFQGQLSLNAGQKYCRMLQGKHYAILLTFIKLPFVINISVLSIFEWPLKTGFTVITFSPQWSNHDHLVLNGHKLHKNFFTITFAAV